MIPAAAALPGPVFPGAGAMMAMGMGMAPPVLPRSLGNTMLPGGMLPQPGQVLVLAPGELFDRSSLLPSTSSCTA